MGRAVNLDSGRSQRPRSGAAYPAALAQNQCLRFLAYRGDRAADTPLRFCPGTVCIAGKGLLVVDADEVSGDVAEHAFVKFPGMGGGVGAPLGGSRPPA